MTSDGYQEVYGGGVVFGTFLTSGSQVHVYSGGMAAGTVVNMGGYQEIDGYGIASGTEVNNGGRQYVSEAGSAIGTVVNSGGTEIVYSYYDDYATMDGSGGSDFGAAYTVLNRGGTIDLRSVQYVSGGTATLDPTTDVLTITEGGETYTLQLAGNYAGERFMLSPGSYGYVSADAVLTTQGSGYGTDITIAPPPYSDFLGNGTSDILFRDPTNGQLGDFLMNNGQPTWAAIGWAEPQPAGGRRRRLQRRRHRRHPVPRSRQRRARRVHHEQQPADLVPHRLGRAPSLQVAGVGDFNGDGTDDILFRDPTTGALGDFLMNNGQPTWAGIGWADPGLQVAGVGDFNGGGTDDILFRDPTTGALGEFVMNNNQPTWAPIGWADPNLQVVGVGDFNGDGTDDILFRDPTTGALGDFLMNNGQPTWLRSAGRTQAGRLPASATTSATAPTTSCSPMRHGALGQFEMNNNQPTWAQVGAIGSTWHVAG